MFNDWTTLSHIRPLHLSVNTQATPRRFKVHTPDCQVVIVQVNPRLGKCSGHFRRVVDQFGRVSDSDQFGRVPDSDQFGRVSDSDQFGQVSDSDQFGRVPGSDQFGQVSDSDQFGQVPGSDQFGQVSDSNQFGRVPGSDQFGQVSESDQFLTQFGRVLANIWNYGSVNTRVTSAQFVAQTSPGLVHVRVTSGHSGSLGGDDPN